jgi:hypothetical protein
MNPFPNCDTPRDIILINKITMRNVRCQHPLSIIHWQNIYSLIYEDEVKILGPLRIYKASQNINYMQLQTSVLIGWTVEIWFPPLRHPQYISQEVWLSTTLPLDNWYFVSKWAEFIYYLGLSTCFEKIQFYHTKVVWSPHPQMWKSVFLCC